jgi:hypothetical protein
MQLMLPGHLKAASPAPPLQRPATEPQPPQADAPLVVDVVLGAIGQFVGQVLDSSATPVAGQMVVVLKEGRPAAQTVTDSAGHFAIERLPVGIYEVRCGESAGLCRLWTPHTAPPAARASLLLTSRNVVLRGQRPMGGSWLKGPGPWLIAVAAIIAVPTALALSLKPRSSAS